MLSISGLLESITDVELRSEEHTSELQSQSNLVCRLLLEKKKKNNQHNTPTINTSQPTSAISSTSVTHFHTYLPTPQSTQATLRPILIYPSSYKQYTRDII